MARTWKDNAAEFAALDQGEGWPFAILVACSVERGKAGRPPENRPDRDDSKVSAQAFAKEAGTTADRVLRYLAAWDRAAKDEVVQEASSLQPLDAHHIQIPDAQFGGKGGYYDGSAQGGGIPTDRVQATPSRTLVGKLTPEQRVEVATEILTTAEPIEQERVAEVIARTPAVSRATQAAIDRRHQEKFDQTIRDAGGNPDLPKDDLGIDRAGIEANRIVAGIKALAADVRGLQRRSEPDQWARYQPALAQAAEGLTLSIQGILVPDSLEGIEL